MKPRHKRMMFVALGLGGLALATTLILGAFQGNLVFFYSPSDVYAQEAPVDRAFRLGGMVADGSVQRENDGLTVHFVVTDHVQSIPVTFTGILPDLFREGQGVVTQGRIGEDGLFYADEVLAKHDEEYMPPEVADALERARAASGGSATTGL